MGEWGVESREWRVVGKEELLIIDQCPMRYAPCQESGNCGGSVLNHF